MILKHTDKLIATFALCAGLVTVSWAQTGKQVADGIVAVVGKNIILKSDVEMQYENLSQQGFARGSGQKCDVFEDLLFEKLLLHQASLDSVTVGEEEVEGTMDRRIQMLISQIGSQRKLEQFYKKTIVEIKDEMRDLVKDQLISQRMRSQITDGIEITPTEVRAYFDKIPGDSLPLINAEVEVAHIVKYPEITEEAEKAAVERLKELKEKVEQGSSFNTLAVLYSEDPGSAKEGGKYEGVKRGQFVKEFEAVAFNLKKGEISEPFKTEYGYHIVQLIERRGQELDLRHILVKPKISDKELEEARKELDSISELISSGMLTFEKAAEFYSDDDKTKYNGGRLMNPNTGDSKWEMDQLDKDIFYAVENLVPGQVSKAVFMRGKEGREAYRLIKLVSKTKAHRANMKEDYHRLKSIALNEKKNKAIEEWVKEKIQSTYVRVNNDIYDCRFNNNWIKDIADESTTQ